MTPVSDNQTTISVPHDLCHFRNPQDTLRRLAGGCHYSVFGAVGQRVPRGFGTPWLGGSTHVVFLLNILTGNDVWKLKIISLLSYFEKVYLIPNSQ